MEQEPEPGVVFVEMSPGDVVWVPLHVAVDPQTEKPVMAVVCLPGERNIHANLITRRGSFLTK